MGLIVIIALFLLVGVSVIPIAQHITTTKNFEENMIYVPKFDYIYINPQAVVLGRLSTKDYGTDENEGVELGRGNSLERANVIAAHFEDRVQYGIKYSEKITDPS